MEESFLAWLRGKTSHLPQVALGIGDDAALLNVDAQHQMVVTADQIVDGVDFLSSEQSLQRIGFKSLAINLSDIAAMGAVPASAIVVLSLPATNPTDTAAKVYEGILAAAEQFQVAISGGDITVYHGPLAISITLIGTAPTGKAWTRSGAIEGDRLLVTGRFGGSILGRHLDVTPRIDLVPQMRNLADVHAAMDVSDGLSLDLDRLCAASGIGAELDVDAIPIHPDAVRLSEQTGKPPVTHALTDGEDFELILAVSEEDAKRLQNADLGVPFTEIGVCTGRTGLWQRMEGNRLLRMTASGYVHGVSSLHEDLQNATPSEEA